MNKISIIVPVYNVEKYLDRCVESIVSQTYENLEIILVDDGSPDNCPQMCDDWAKKDERIRVVHKTNGGLSSARNTGLEIATGSLIAFVDSDDWLEPDMYRKLCTAILQYDADIAMCATDSVDMEGNNIATGTTPTLKNSKEKIIIYSNNSEIMEAHISPSEIAGWINSGVWNKLYRAHIVNGVLFPKGRLYEDVFTMYKYLHKASKMAYIPWHGYNYFQREGSICNKKFDGRNMDLLDANVERYEFICENYKHLEIPAREQVVDCCFNLAFKIVEEEVISQYKPQVKQIKKAFKKYASLDLYKTYSIKRLAALNLFVVSPHIFRLAVHLLSRGK